MEERVYGGESTSAASSSPQPEGETGASSNSCGETETSMGKDGSSKPTPEIADAGVVGEDEENESSKKEENGACIVSISSSNETENTEDCSTERVCRICHLNQDHRSILIQLGCSCKDDLGISHLHCAETWFKRKGNRRCEICGGTAINVTGPGERGGQYSNTMAMNQRRRTARSYTPSSDMAAQGSSCCGRRGCNLFLTSLALAFTFLWLFHFP